MKPVNKRLDVIYDGHCSFCLRSLRLVQTLDTRRLMRLHDAHQSETFSKFSELRDADVEEAMFVCVEGESPYRGFFAFRRLLWAGPLLWVFLPLFYFPGAAIVGPHLYAWIARNRTRLGCRSQFCEIPTVPPGHTNV